jgi:hypothetical protein
MMDQCMDMMGSMMGGSMMGSGVMLVLLLIVFLVWVIGLAAVGSLIFWGIRRLSSSVSALLVVRRTSENTHSGHLGE